MYLVVVSRTQHLCLLGSQPPYTRLTPTIEARLDVCQDREYSVINRRARDLCSIMGVDNRTFDN